MRLTNLSPIQNLKSKIPALDISVNMVRQWRRRWIETADLSKTVMERLLDNWRSGAPLKFTLEQQVECMAIAGMNFGF